MRLIARQGIWSTGMTLIGVAGSFLISVIIARLFGPDGRGTYAFALLLIHTVAFVFNPGLYASANYFLSSGEIVAERVWGVVLTGSLFCAGFAVATALILIHFLTLSGVDSEVAQLTANIAIGVGVTVLNTTLNGVLFGLRKIAVASAITGIAPLIYLVMVILLGISEQHHLAFYLWGYVGILSLEATLRLSVVARCLRSNVSGIRKHEVIRTLRYGASVYSGRLLMLFAQKIDTYSVIFFLGSTALGYYSVASTFAEQLLLIPTAISMVILNNIVRESPKIATHMTAQLFHITILTSLGMGAVLALGGSTALYFIYGPAFAQAIVPFLLMIPGLVCVSGYLMLEPFFQSQQQPLLAMKATLIGVLTNLGGSLVLTPTHGITGAALAYTLSYVVQMVVAAFYFLRLTGLPWQGLFQWEYGMVLKKWYTSLPIRPAQRG